MNIGGLQRFSMLDYPGKISAIIFTQGCNFRCPYCHNPELVDPARYSTLIPVQEILMFLSSRKGLLNAVTITGGEPTLQSGLIPFLLQVKALDYSVKLDTNGSFPELIQECIELDLVDYWALDIKAPLDIYPVVTQSPVDVSDITTSMDLIRRSSKLYEFRTTMFDKLLTWADIDRIKDILHSGDNFSLQQCRYKKTLTDLSHKDDKQPNASKSMISAKEAQDLLDWGRDHRIKVNLRTL